MPVTRKKTLGRFQTETDCRIESPKTLPKIALQIAPLHGAVCRQWKRCGKPNCKCANGNLHGPYFYRFWYVGGKLRKSYIKKADAPTIMAACKAYKEQYRNFREVLRWSFNDWRNLSDSLKGVRPDE